ncbi:MAG TPA: hypothetical protein PK453_03375 [Leptospiraceae bacterium]|nr:hypothetical protein [Leptospiraceae bacterium]HMY69008.1 hypothetical protein [Leptospiraceae bacterium]HNF12683.1 hypothetical protein [Leptospiraceae bacterium]HNF23228.1 hypothetical protein [Leptospiraceae bacterium]HNI94828.1 hypothetical protein [Leptospiraceae bacterium]
MSNAKYNVEPGFFSAGIIQLVLNYNFLRYGIWEPSKIDLRMTPLEILPDVKLLKNEVGFPLQNQEKSLVVGTVRMGYGHHRMAYALYTWGLKKYSQIYLHDLIGLGSKESDAIKDVDGFYSQMSRAASEMGGMIEWSWGMLMSQGGISSLHTSLAFAKRYVNLMGNISRDNPYISTYPLNGQIAVEAGVKKVIHLIPDNYPQYYLLVPGALNLVQSPAAYLKFIEMGFPKENLSIAGHWVSEKIGANSIFHSECRLERAEKKLKRRITLAIGGAGAQKNFTKSLLESLKESLLKDKFQLFINTGDHSGLFHELKDHCKSIGIPFDEVTDRVSMETFLKDAELSKMTDLNRKSLVFFHFEDYFTAFSATDDLICVSDILMTKPSELAFFPIPKIFIRRVGDHEAASAFRSMELGEGTMECREVEHTVEMVNILTGADDLFRRMCECIIRNSREGIYDGAKRAIEQALG